MRILRLTSHMQQQIFAQSASVQTNRRPAQLSNSADCSVATFSKRSPDTIPAQINHLATRGEARRGTLLSYLIRQHRIDIASRRRSSGCCLSSGPGVPSTQFASGPVCRSLAIKRPPFVHTTSSRPAVGWMFSTPALLVALSLSTCFLVMG